MAAILRRGRRLCRCALLVGEDLLVESTRGQLPGQLAALGATLSYAFNGVYAKGFPLRIPLGSLWEVFW